MVARHHHHQCLASVFPCTHGSDVSPKIFLLHNCLSWASPTFKPKSFMSLLTHCNHVFLPLPSVSKSAILARQWQPSKLIGNHGLRPVAFFGNQKIFFIILKL